MSLVMPNILPAAPEIFVFSMACVILVADLFLTERRRVASYWLTQLTLVGAALITLQGLAAARAFAFHNMFVRDALADVLKLATYVITAFVFAYSRDYLRVRDLLRGEYFVLGLFGVVGMMVMASASHFLTLYLGLELLSLSLYAMAAFQRASGPFHRWVPDVDHGAPTSVTLYIGTAPKLAAFAVIMRLLVGGLEEMSGSWRDMLAILAVLSMGLGH